MPNAPFLGPGQVSLVWRVLWRTILVGAALFLVPPTGQAPSVEQMGPAFVLVAAWNHRAGIVGQGRWGLALVEAALWLFLGGHWAAVMILAFSEPR